MKTFLALILVCLCHLSFSYDSTKLHIRLKIMDSTMIPTHTDSNDCPNSAFETWLVQHKVTMVVKVHSNVYDTIGELGYKYKIFHDNVLIYGKAISIYYNCHPPCWM